MWIDQSDMKMCCMQPLHKFIKLRLMWPAMSPLVGTNVALPTSSMPFKSIAHIKRLHIHKRSLYSFFFDFLSSCLPHLLLLFLLKLSIARQSFVPLRVPNDLSYLLTPQTWITHAHLHIGTHTLTHISIHINLHAYQRIFLFFWGLPDPNYVVLFVVATATSNSKNQFNSFSIVFFSVNQTKWTAFAGRRNVSLFWRRYFYFVVCTKKFYYRLK